MHMFVVILIIQSIRQMIIPYSLACAVTFAVLNYH
jgi:hypothetical protein